MGAIYFKEIRLEITKMTASLFTLPILEIEKRQSQFTIHFFFFIICSPWAQFNNVRKIARREKPNQTRRFKILRI